MKHFFKTIPFICFIFLISCKKTDKETPKVQPGNTTGFTTSIKGDWELRELIGGLRAPNSSPYFPPGNGFIWKFTDSAYQLYSKGQSVSEGNYVLTKDTSLATGRFMDALIFPQNYNDKIYFEFNRDTLIFYRGVIAADGTTEKYVKLQNNR